MPSALWKRGLLFIYFGMDGRGKWRLNSHKMKIQMKIAWPKYFIIAGVAIFSFLTAYYLRQNGLLAKATAAPGIIALLGALYQIFRDNAAFERELMKQNENNDFILSATSHMAIVAFDKHAAFAEKYVAEVHHCIGSLIQTGATKNALEQARNLGAIRREFTIWETDDMSKTLDRFEQALRTIGAQATTKPEEVYDIFNKVLGFEKAPETLSDEIIWSVVIQRIRELLNIAGLTKLRQNYIKRALENCP
jgi:hypothetical protein